MPTFRSYLRKRMDLAVDHEQIRRRVAIGEEMTPRRVGLREMTAVSKARACIQEIQTTLLRRHLS